MTNIKITVDYDGTEYCGWQLQENTGATIQNKLEQAVSRLNKTQTRVHGAGRTDSGVHAHGQVANFELKVPIPEENIPLAINSELPPDIVCHKAQKADPDFHARYDARGKKYCYRFSNNRFCSVFDLRFVYNIYQKLEIENMQTGLSTFCGRHNFSSFEASGSEVNTSVRTINSIKLERKENSFFNSKTEFHLIIDGDGFLYNMVRIIVGTLIERGLGKINSSYKEIIESKNRHQAGFTAPAKGLTLLEVYY